MCRGHGAQRLHSMFFITKGKDTGGRSQEDNNSLRLYMKIITILSAIR